LVVPAASIGWPRPPRPRGGARPGTGAGAHTRRNPQRQAAVALIAGTVSVGGAGLNGNRGDPRLVSWRTARWTAGALPTAAKLVSSARSVAPPTERATAALAETELRRAARRVRPVAGDNAGAPVRGGATGAPSQHVRLHRRVNVRCLVARLRLVGALRGGRGHGWRQAGCLAPGCGTPVLPPGDRPIGRRGDRNDDFRPESARFACHGCPLRLSSRCALTQTSTVPRRFRRHPRVVGTAQVGPRSRHVMGATL